MKIFMERKLPDLKMQFLKDRNDFVNELVKHLDRVKRGAVYFLGMTLYGTDRVLECSYSISRILDVFNQVLINTTRFNLINEII